MCNVDTRGQQNLVANLNETQCSDQSWTECPSDTCNHGGCRNGCASKACTKMGCRDYDKKENQLCVVYFNNCKDGLKCVDQDDGCNNDIGRCVKLGKNQKHDTKFAINKKVRLTFFCNFCSDGI